ncbi:MAG: M1 family aminopeptidase [Gemmatimonadaceae bacterium]|nr:M1 family aminopeptidase [Gemmatimonadaceae bacterium]
MRSLRPSLARLALASVVALSSLAAQRTDPLMAPGVSAALARQRAERLHDTRYVLALDLTAADSATGRVSISFVARATPRQDVLLDFRGRALVALDVNGTPVDVRDSTTWNGHHIRLPARTLRRGINRVQARFVTAIAASGAAIIRSRDAADGRTYLYTLLVPSDANLLFPCFDQPDLKARVTLTLTIPPDWRALANGALAADDSSATRRVVRFIKTPPLSTYLVAFAAGPWAVATRSASIRPGEPAMPVSLWMRQSRVAEAEVDTLLVMNARALAWLGEWFGVPYAFGKYDALLAPAFPFGGMEHPGAVFYNEQSFIYRERPTRAQLLGRQATTYHEVAHQWFGDYLTMRWFDDLWLKEGFATFMAARMQAALEPTADTWRTFHLRNKPVAYATDLTLGTTPIWQQLDNLDQAKSNYGPIVYNKAPSILRQLEYVVGERAFQQGVRSLLARHRYGNATWRELLAAIGRASGRDLTAWGRQWILRPGMPIIETQLALGARGITRLVLTQRAAQPSLSGTQPWPIRTRVRLHYAHGTDRVFDVSLDGRETEVVQARGLPAPDYVFANDGDFAYALVLPDARSQAWLLEQLPTVRELFPRTMLWGALWDVVRDGALDPARFAALALRAIPTERDEELTGTLVQRTVTAIERFTPAGAEALRDSAVRVFLAGAADSTRSYGQRKVQLDAVIDLARAPGALARLDAMLDSTTVAGLPLRAPTRWGIVTRLVARGAPSAAARLAQERVTDASSEGRRLAYVAAAAQGDSATKAALFTAWFADTTLNEQWVTSALGAFHSADHAALTRRYLLPALDSLPFIQRNRRIFFLGAWIGATFGGQRDADALEAIDGWLARQQVLAPDLRRKVLQARDELARTVRIRARYGVRTASGRWRSADGGIHGGGSTAGSSGSEPRSASRWAVTLDR